MAETICQICHRVQAGTKPNFPGEKATHGMCARCNAANEEYLGAKISDLLNPALREDSLVKDAIEYAKGYVRDEVRDNVSWVGPEPKISDEAIKFYDLISAEVRNEFQSEADREIRKV